VLGKFPHQLSGGQLQRVLVARALLLDIDLLIADEIISMLDASTRIDVLNLLGDLKQRGLVIVFITHDLSLREVLCRLHEEYAPPPLYVTEFGAAFDDVRVHDGRIHDIDRIAFLDASIEAIDAAVEAGVDVRGAFVWSLLDNFEWAEGYTKRFGLVYVDYPTLERIPKSSFAWYRDLIAERRRTADRAAA
jgi:hypothetical protein